MYWIIFFDFGFGEGEVNFIMVEVEALSPNK